MNTMEFPSELELMSDQSYTDFLRYIQKLSYQVQEVQHTYIMQHIYTIFSTFPAFNIFLGALKMWVSTATQLHT
jgi:hypothetical protein